MMLRRDRLPFSRALSADVDRAVRPGEAILKLQRKLGFWSVFCIASGAMISSGLFVLPGLAFSQVRSAVVLAGSPDERNYHLRALMAVAHIVQEDKFLDRWLSASKAGHLRDVVLLSSRQRNA